MSRRMICEEGEGVKPSDDPIWIPVEPAPPMDWRPKCYTNPGFRLLNNIQRECDHSCIGCPYRKRD